MAELVLVHSDAQCRGFCIWRVGWSISEEPQLWEWKKRMVTYVQLILFELFELVGVEG